MIWWGDEADGERILAFTVGGCYRRCDDINRNADEGVRYYPATPPFDPANVTVEASPLKPE